VLTLPLGSELQEILCLGAHCDDIEIGCGGTLASLRRARPQLRVTVVMFAGSAERAAESRVALTRLLGEGAQARIEIYDYRDGYFPAQWADIKDRIGELRRSIAPQLVLTHYERDRHQDHRTVSELTWQAFRDHLVLEYEIPKYDGDLSAPNVFAPLAVDCVDLKVDVLLRAFPSQADKQWFTADTFRGLMRQRGIECQSPSGFAEAFYGRKLAMRL